MYMLNALSLLSSANTTLFGMRPSSDRNSSKASGLLYRQAIVLPILTILMPPSSRCSSHGSFKRAVQADSGSPDSASTRSIISTAS